MDSQATTIMRGREYRAAQATQHDPDAFANALLVIRQWDRLPNAWNCPNATRLTMAAVYRSWGVTVTVIDAAANTNNEVWEF